MELERKERWQLLGALASDVMRDGMLENDISMESSERMDLLIQLYLQVEQAIPIEWFRPDPDNSHNYYPDFNSCEVLVQISERAKRKIWADTPRTFDLFLRKSPEIESLLSSDEIYSQFRATLCRVLCTSSILLGGWYCQGMAFLAGSCLIYFKEFRTSRELDTFSQRRLGISSCSIYHHCFLKENHLEALYQDSILLSAYMSELAYQLSNYNETALVYHHMISIGFTVHYFALEWFTACYLLSVSHAFSLLIHDIFIYGNTHRRSDFLIKLGISMISLLSPQLLTYTCESSLPPSLSSFVHSKTAFETLHMEFKSLVLSLPPIEVMQRALEYQMVPHEGIASLSVLQLLSEAPDDLLRIHSLARVGTESLPTEPEPQVKECVDCVIS
jgi:hypothetical protein